MAEPEQWAEELYVQAHNLIGVEAIALIQRAFEERERERLDRIAESVGETIAAEFNGFWAKEDLLEEIPGLIRQALATRQDAPKACSEDSHDQ